MHFCNRLAHATMKCQNLFFLLLNLKSRYIDFVATYDWLRANNALFMGFPSVSGQCNWFFMLHWLTSCVLMGPVIGLRCWLIRTPPSHFSAIFIFFQLRIVKNRPKVLVMMVKLQIFIGALISLYCKNLISFMY